MRHGDDQIGLFGNGYELKGGKQPQVRMLPPHQCLESSEQSCVQRHDGLVMKPQLFPFNGAAQIGFYLEQPYGLLVHGFVKYLVPAFTRRFGTIHGGVGVAQ